MTLLFRSYDSGPFHLLSSPPVVLPSRPPRSLPGDRFIDGVVERGLHRGIVGIVDFKSRVSMGRSPHGIPLYLFYPFDAGYPPFIVGSKTRHEENMICTVEFAAWPDSSEWPRGALQERLGPVADPSVEREGIRRAAAVGTLTEEGMKVPDLAAYKPETWDAVFNIDPVGCEDVDDILAYKVTPSGVKWLIGIADVAAHVPEGSPLDLVAASRGQTLYEDGTVVAPMLPHILSTRLASLRRDGTARPVVGLVLLVEGGTVTFEGLELHQVVVTQALTYETVPAEIGSRVSALCAALGRASSDPHEWIETVMVAYNCHVAQILRTHCVGLLRRLPASEAPRYATIAESSGCAEIAHLGRAAGEYCDPTTADVSHAGVGVPEYCHASSPLRRYADLINQRCIHALLRGEPPTPSNVYAEHLNHRAFVARRMERDLWFLAHVPTGVISSTRGIVLSEDSVYCPEWKRVVTVRAVGDREVVIRAFVDPASPRRRVICQAVT